MDAKQTASENDTRTVFVIQDKTDDRLFSGLKNAGTWHWTIIPWFALICITKRKAKDTITMHKLTNCRICKLTMILEPSENSDEGL
jgi:hypothetical protein